MKAIILAALAIMACASPARAANCWWTPYGYVCQPGWTWQEGRPWSEYEWRERHRHHEEHEHERERWRDHGPYDERR